MNAVLHEPQRLTRRRIARRPLADALFRSAVANVHGFLNDLPAHVAAQRVYRDDVRLAGYLLHQKAAVDPALTSVPEWAGALARETMAEFFTVLAPESAFAQLAALGQRATFRNGKVRVPGRSATPTLAGDFIGENQPIPVKKGTVLAALLGPKKMGALTAMSSEMKDAADMESFLRQAMVEDTAGVLDTRFLDANPATAVRPAGLLNGVTLTPSAGATLADIVVDLKTAIAPILLAGGGRRLVLLLNPLQALTLSLTTDAAGSLVWPEAARKVAIAHVIVSNSVPVGTVIAVDAADFVTVSDDAPQFEMSRNATLHMDDAPDAINDGTMATPITSLFQQDAIGVRLILQVNWTMRRPGMVAGVSDVEW